MRETPHLPNPQSSAKEFQPRGRAALLAHHPWLTFLLPLLVFMLAGTLEPTPDALGGQMIGLAIPYAYYPWIYTLKILLTTAAIIFVLPGYREFPLRLSPLAVAAGAVGVIVWVGLCRLNIEQRLLVPLGLARFIDLGTRSGFNPLEELQENPTWAWGFLAIRFAGLALVVPLAEEFFLRGFLMRFVVDARWWEVPMGKANTWAVVLATLVPMLMHPAELLAAAAWFSLITWMYLRTRNVWDCVLAHAVTNLLLGFYVVAWDQWQLM
jgi:CAAX prenyl protease-like protein